VRVKICGVTRPDDAALALKLGADAIGCVFYPGSPRAVTVATALEVASRLGDEAELVGLFVNPSVREVLEVLERVPLHCLQFHGAEPPQFCGQFKKPYIKAVPMQADTDLAAVNLEYEGAQALLLDSVHEGRFGGSGAQFDWDWVDATLRRRIILAGGLRPDNVASAIRQVQPVAVDVSSGVEQEKGIKDPDKMAEFISAALGAFEEVTS